MTETTAVVDARDTTSILAMLGMVRTIWSPWATLLTCFKDDPPDAQLEPTIDYYRRLFTSPGSNQNLNMVEFFRDMSHGRLDLSGSKVFGWFRLSTNRGTWHFPTDRQRLLDSAKSMATLAGVPLSNFAGVCVATPKSAGSVDCTGWGWPGGMATLCDTEGCIWPSLLGQEMGHGYGLAHARRAGSEDDYQDPWDVMSTRVWPAMMAANADYGFVGPGLNAWNMRSRGWLNEARVWSPMNPNAAWEQTLTLRPLHQRDEQGWLAADLGPYLVELRASEKWDAAIPNACVLVHRFSDNHSYLESGVSGHQGLVNGDRFVGQTFFGHYELEVHQVDEANRAATVHLRARPYTYPVWLAPRTAARISQIVAGMSGHPDALTVGDEVLDLPAKGPVRELVKQVVRYLKTDLEGDVAIAMTSRRAALTEIARLVGQLYHEAEPMSEPPPGREAEPQK